MFTTIENRWPRDVMQFAGAAAFVLLVWFSAVAVLTRFAEPSSSVMVFGPIENTLKALGQSEMTLVAGGTGFLVVQGDQPGFVKTLYRQGAWLVMPSIVDGCGLASYLRKRSMRGGEQKVVRADRNR
jgi:hypothetical protein